MNSLTDSLSNHLTIQEVLTRLQQSRAVDGLALFRSLSRASHDHISDYDVLVLTSNPPIPIFQMLTYIDGRMTDIVFVEVDTADGLLSKQQPVSATSFEGYFLQKMLKAQIVYDRSSRLARIQQYAQQSQQLLLPTSESDLYAIWFWLTHGLLHMKRMSQSHDETYITAVNLMLMGGLHGICRDYFRARHLPWEGEKAGIRYLQSHDTEFLDLLNSAIAETDLTSRLSLYEQLVVRTLEPIAELGTSGLTAFYLRDTPHTQTSLKKALNFWQDLIGSI